MTLDELGASLPNGFHDAELSALAIDFVKREARLILDIWIADDTKNPEEIETYRLAELALSGLLFWVCEAPDARYPFHEATDLTIDIGPMERIKEKPTRLPPVPADAFVNWIFVTEWNAFIYVAAQDASLEWRGKNRMRASIKPPGLSRP